MLTPRECVVILAEGLSNKAIALREDDTARHACAAGVTSRVANARYAKSEQTFVCPDNGGRTGASARGELRGRGGDMRHGTGDGVTEAADSVGARP